MLHMLMQSPFETNVLLINQMLEPLDDFIALQNGVFISLANNVFCHEFQSAPCSLFVLKEDLLARGLLSKVNPVFRIINYSKFVYLTVKHKNQIKW
ncbi:Protein TusB [Buchnera aphidicola (Thelaxes suberi)]|uniref:sulfurtransferase complex subunit TusB n=1 Tax=Buchnera aphidicola TaxID=9 RepID=UPI003463C24D